MILCNFDFGVIFLRANHVARAGRTVRAPRVTRVVSRLKRVGRSYDLTLTSMTSTNMAAIDIRDIMQVFYLYMQLCKEDT